MYQTDGILKMYADSGLRTMEDWTTLGRNITGGTKPRVDTSHRGVMVSLYSRDQTQPRVAAKRD
jgi:hypothetical protein